MRSILSRLILLCLLLSGCAASNFVTDLSIPNPGSLHGYTSINDVQQKHFVPNAYQAIRSIPTIDGHTWFGKPFVSGVNFWSSFSSVLLFNGYGLKVIIPHERLYSSSGLETIIHEYVHHLDYMDRQGLGEFIDHAEFTEALERMLRSPFYDEVAEDVLDSSDRFVTNVFGIGSLSEEIAYMADKLVTEGGPQYMWHVFRNILINPRKDKNNNKK